MPLTISSLFSKDLNKAYFLPAYPTTFRNDYWLKNDKKYQNFDFPPLALKLYESIVPFRNLSVFGDDIPVLLEQEPPLYLIEHWKKWLPAFPFPQLKKVEEGFGDDVPIVTLQALESIPEKKHSINPDVLYWLQLKSTIPEIGVPCPKHFKENGDISFPCLVKVDQSLSGMGHRLAESETELFHILTNVRENFGWKNGIVIQEIIQDIKEVPSVQLYLHKSGEIVWLGTTVCGYDIFDWNSATLDLEKQKYYYNLFYEEFTVPITNFLHNQGYFGFVNYEIIVTNRGRYLVDLNPRVSGTTAYTVIAKHMSDTDLTHSCLIPFAEIQSTAQKVIDKVDRLNTSRDNAKATVMAAVDDNKKCIATVCVFATTKEEVDILRNEILNTIDF